MLPAVVRPAIPRAALRPSMSVNLPPLRAVRLLDQLRERVRMLHYSRRTEQAYLYWSRAFIRFHGLRHPAEMGGPEVEAYLTYLASDRGLSPSSHRQALSALLFLYGKVLGLQLPWMQEIGRPAPSLRRDLSSRVHARGSGFSHRTPVLRMGCSAVRSPLDSLPTTELLQSGPW